MQYNHQFRTLAENSVGYVGICEGCRTVNVAFQNSLFCLTLEQFDTFAEMIYERQAMRPFCTTHGKEYLLTTPMANYFILFSDDELKQLSDLLREAAPVLAAELILNVSQTE